MNSVKKEIHSGQLYYGGQAVTWHDKGASEKKASQIYLFSTATSAIRKQCYRNFSFCRSLCDFETYRYFVGFISVWFAFESFTFSITLSNLIWSIPT